MNKMPANRHMWRTEGRETQPADGPSVWRVLSRLDVRLRSLDPRAFCRMFAMSKHTLDVKRPHGLVRSPVNV